MTKPDKTNGENTEYSTNGSTGQREKAPAEPVCLTTLGEKKTMKKENDQKTLKHDYQEIVHIVMQALNEWDPYELIEAGAPENEFVEEATQIAAIIKKTKTPTELAHLISDVFSRSFDSYVFSVEECLPVASRILGDLEAHRLLK